MKSSIIKTIEIEETQDEDNKTSNFNRNQTDHVRPIFRQHEKDTLTAGQGVPINSQPGKSDLAIPEYSIVSLCTEHRVGTAASDREGVEANSEGSTDLC